MLKMAYFFRKIQTSTAQKMKFSIKDFFNKYGFGPADLVTCTDEIFNANFIFL